MSKKLTWLVVVDLPIEDEKTVITFYQAIELYNLNDALYIAKNEIKEKDVVSVVVYKKIEGEPIEYFAEFNKDEK